MSTNGYPFMPAALRERGLWALAAQDRPRDRLWVHALLLLATLLSTTVVGAGLAQDFAAGISPSISVGLDGYSQIWHDPSYLLQGLPFSLTLLAILLAHEFGHYLAARYYYVDATLPFFLPAPTPIGTMGAFIRIRSAILSKRILFDIGVAGPLGGFALLIVPLAVGVSLSRVVPGIGSHSELVFGTPTILRLFEMIHFPHVATADIYLHPVARAAWVGLLATALNLLPIGQLDGGHILYAFLGERTKVLSRIFVALLVVPLGIRFSLMPLRLNFTPSWLVWAAILFFFGMRHPTIVDPVPVGRTRMWLGFAALVMFLLSFTAVPIGS